MLAVQKGLIALAVLLICVRTPTVGTAALALATGSALGTLLSLFVIKNSLRLPIKVEWRPAEWTEWLKTTLPLALANIMIVAYGRFGILFLPSLRGEAETGLYAAAHKLFEAGYILPIALVGVLMPRLSKSHRESEEAFASDLRKTLKNIGLLCLAWLIVVEPLSLYFIRFLFGEQYSASVPVLRVLFMVNAVVIVNVMLAHVMIILNRLTWHATNAVLTGAVCALFTYIGIRRMGGIGAAYGLLAAEGVFTVLTVFALLRVRYAAFLRQGQ
jgi:O-antigen/teichoic acid export membrane protein